MNKFTKKWPFLLLFGVVIFFIFSSGYSALYTNFVCARPNQDNLMAHVCSIYKSQLDSLEVYTINVGKETILYFNLMFGDCYDKCRSTSYFEYTGFYYKDKVYPSDVLNEVELPEIFHTEAFWVSSAYKGKKSLEGLGVSVLDDLTSSPYTSPSELSEIYYFIKKNDAELSSNRSISSISSSVLRNLSINPNTPYDILYQITYPESRSNMSDRRGEITTDMYEIVNSNLMKDSKIVYVLNDAMLQDISTAGMPEYMVGNAVKDNEETISYFLSAYYWDSEGEDCSNVNRIYKLDVLKNKIEMIYEESRELFDSSHIGHKGCNKMIYLEGVNKNSIILSYVDPQHRNACSETWVNPYVKHFVINKHQAGSMEYYAAPTRLLLEGRDVAVSLGCFQNGPSSYLRWLKNFDTSTVNY